MIASPDARVLRDAFALDPATCFLNHGSFGACPRDVLRRQAEVRDALEADPVDFFLHRYEPELDAAREALAAFVGASTDDLVFVRNATTAVSSVLGSLDAPPGGELLATTHGYNACNNALRRLAERTGNTVRFVPLPFPVSDPNEIVEALQAAHSPRTRLVLLDHVTSPTALVLPVAALVRWFEDRGTPVLVDGAHAPGQVPLDLDALGASWYTGNLHKWVCAPRGAAFLHARRDRREGLRPAVTSHGYNATRTDRSRFHAEFDWTGTDDPGAWLSVATALSRVPALVGGDWGAVMARNHALALGARRTLLNALGGDAPAPDAMVGAMVALRLVNDPEPPSDHPLVPSRLQLRLHAAHRIQVPVIPFPAAPERVIRISAHLHNTPADAERLAEALRAEGVTLAAGPHDRSPPR